jgi:hypothetical protein
MLSNSSALHQGANQYNVSSSLTASPITAYYSPVRVLPDTFQYALVIGAIPMFLMLLANALFHLLDF